ALRARRFRAVPSHERAHAFPRRLQAGPRRRSCGIGESGMGLIQEIDFGTPESRAEKQVTLTVDGRSVTVPEGTSIMRASMEAGIEIPKLCATDSLDSFGSCRICLVEIDGRAGTPASCTTPVGEGMVVRTQSERLD